MSRGTFDIDMSRRKYDVEKKVHLGILAVVVLGAAVALGLGIRAWRMQVRPHITACGFDSHGAYAKVRVDNPLDTRHKTRSSFSAWRVPHMTRPGRA